MRDSRENVFDLYGDSRENLLELLTVVIILSLISSVRGVHRQQFICTEFNLEFDGLVLRFGVWGLGCHVSV